MTGVLGSLDTGLQPDIWYSIQSYATDYYIGVGNSSTIAQLSSGTDDTSLWQFIPGPSSASYALRSKTSEGRYCLYPGPELKLCGSIAAQYRVFNAASDDAADIFVPSTESESAALYVQGDSSAGDGVDTADLNPLEGDQVELLFAVKSVGRVDVEAYPTALPSASPAATQGVNMTTLTTSTSQLSGSSTPSPSSSPSSSSVEATSTGIPSSSTSESSAGPATVSSTEVITQDASPVPTSLAGRATSTILVDAATTGPSSSASATSGVEGSTGAGAILRGSDLMMGLAAVAGLWLA